MKRVFRVAALAIIAPLSLTLVLATSAAASNDTPAATSSMSASAAIAAAHLAQTVEASTVMPDSPVGCNAGNFCIYSLVSPGICTFSCLQPCDQTAANVKHTYTTCANQDESLYNNMSSGKARLFFAADQGGAWICIDHGQFIDNLNTGSSRNGGGPYEFDQGSGKAGFDQDVWRNAHSVQTLSSGSCNPDE
jgi:hypothetical protein